MMWNTTENKFIHLFSPMITMMMKETFELYDQIKHESRTELCAKLKGHLQYLRDYIECVGDLFKHKFLVFLCNPSSFHWITFIMVNPSVIYLRGDSSKKQNDNKGQFTSWSVLDSTGYSKTNLQKAKETRLMTTIDC